MRPATLAAAALLIAGCGGSSNSSSSSTEASVSSTTTTASNASQTSTTSAGVKTKRKRKRKTTSHTTVTKVTESTTTPPAPPKHQPAPLIYTGSGTRTVGDFTIHYSSYLDWKCAGTCAPFQINNSLTDTAAINVDAAGPGSGTVVLTPGKYHKLTVTTDGQWTLTLKAVQ